MEVGKRPWLCFLIFSPFCKHYYREDSWPFTENLLKPAQNSLWRSKEDTSGWVENSIPGAHSTVWRAAVSTPLLQLPTTSENCLCCWKWERDLGIQTGQMSGCKLRMSEVLSKCQVLRWNRCFYNLTLLLNKLPALHMNALCPSTVSVASTTDGQAEFSGNFAFDCIW